MLNWTTMVRRSDPRSAGYFGCRLQLATVWIVPTPELELSRIYIRSLSSFYSDCNGPEWPRPLHSLFEHVIKSIRCKHTDSWIFFVLVIIHANAESEYRMYLDIHGCVNSLQWGSHGKLEDREWVNGQRLENSYLLTHTSSSKKPR